MNYRPENFTLNTAHPLYRGLVVASLSGRPYENVRDRETVNVGVIPTRALNRPAWECPDVGLNEYLTYDKAWINPLSSDFSLAMWMRIGSSVTGNSYLLGSGTNSSAVDHISLSLDAGFGNGKLYTSCSNGSTRTLAGPSVDVRGSWVHVAAIYTKGSTLRLYVGGKQAATAADITTGDIDITSGAFLYGAGTKSSSEAVKFADPMIWHRALSIQELRWLCVPSDPMLGGFLKARRWVNVPVAAAGGAFQSAWAYRATQIVIPGMSQ